jgi:hypothetical protein
MVRRSALGAFRPDAGYRSDEFVQCATRLDQCLSSEPHSLEHGSQDMAVQHHEQGAGKQHDRDRQQSDPLADTYVLEVLV